MRDISNFIRQIFHYITEESNLACVWLSSDKTILYLNDFAAEIYGWTKEVEGENFSLLCREQGIEDVCERYLPKQDFNEPVTEVISDFHVKKFHTRMIRWNFFPIKDQ